MGHASLAALFVDIADPIEIHEPPLALGSLFTSRDDPVDFGEMRSQIQTLKQGLCGNESHRGGNRAEDFNAINRVHAATRHAEPDVRIALAPIRRETISNAVGTL